MATAPTNHLVYITDMFGSTNAGLIGGGGTTSNNGGMNTLEAYGTHHIPAVLNLDAVKTIVVERQSPVAITIVFMDNSFLIFDDSIAGITGTPAKDILINAFSSTEIKSGDEITAIESLLGL